MFNATPCLPGLALWRLHQVQVATKRCLAPLQALWGSFLDDLLSAAKTSSGCNSRERLWTVPLTFWTFLSQVLCPGSSCREAVRKAAAWVRAAKGQILSEEDSAYCQARSRLPAKVLFKVWHAVCRQLQERSTHQWCGLEIFIVDGAECQTPDTARQSRALAPAPEPKTRLWLPSHSISSAVFLSVGSTPAPQNCSHGHLRTATSGQTLGHYSSRICSAGRSKLLWLCAVGAHRPARHSFRLPPPSRSATRYARRPPLR